jgi:hypothetical protein
MPVVYLMAALAVQPPPSDKVVLKSTDAKEIKAARTYLESAGIACKQHVERLEKLGVLTVLTPEGFGKMLVPAPLSQPDESVAEVFGEKTFGELMRDGNKMVAHQGVLLTPLISNFANATAHMPIETKDAPHRAFLGNKEAALKTALAHCARLETLAVRLKEPVSKP